jgi:BirA family biotin operon repressor/biotin-[acetyl-CoA-carboxylase] ligase
LTEIYFYVNLSFVMVNVKSSRHNLIVLLKEINGPLSGESLSRHLGVSRVAVWKQINKLEEMGYEIHSSRKGYELIKEPADTLEPHLFDHPEQFYCLKETGSTMDYCDRILRKKADPGEFIVTAETQTAGRGRHRRDWISQAGGLFFTHSIPINLPNHLSYRSTMAALIGLTEVLREDFSLPAVIKWPNDILIENKKVIGLLSSGLCEGERIVRCNLGIGINVNNAPPLQGTTNSLSRLTGRDLSRSDLMKGYLKKWKFYQKNHDSLNHLYIKYMNPFKGDVKILTERDSPLSGRFKTFSREGALILESGEKIYPGECKKVLSSPYMN